MKLGDKVEFNTKVNIDPLGSHCSLCGRKTNARFWFPIDWDDRISLETDAEQFKGFYPVGSECSKRFEKGILIERN